MRRLAIHTPIRTSTPNRMSISRRVSPLVLLCGMQLVFFTRQGNTVRFGVPAARADSLVDIGDPRYAHRPLPKQKEPTVRRIRHIVYPTLGLPALVARKGRFNVWIHTRMNTVVRQDWQVRLKTRWGKKGGQTYRSKVLRVRKIKGKPLVRLTVAVPLAVPRDHYHLFIHGPGGFFDRQPRAVRMLGELRWPLRFVLMSDHQLWDPSWKVKPGNLNSGTYPRRGQKNINKRITLQTIREMELLDPDFIVHAGDLLYGLEYHKEYPEMWSWLYRSRMAIFTVPGNHDAYAIYKLKIRGNLRRMGRSFLACRRVFPRKADWWQIWKYISCVYQDIKRVLFDNLLHDGLESYKRTFGPPYYSFELGPYHFVGLNTYDGTNRRRHAFSIFLPLRSLRLGAPAVDNYGGYLSRRQLQWLRSDVEEAAARGKTIVFLGHNDPRGNAKRRRYHPNEPFPTDPIGADHFEEWNYDGKQWDSNPKDDRSAETAQRNNAHALLRLVADYGAYYLSGHVHEDRQTVYRKGQTILGDIKARHRLEFIRVTTAASGVRPGAYWGYRLFKADRRGRIDTRPYFAGRSSRKLLSVPSGNFWTQTTKMPEGPLITIKNGLPLVEPLTLRLRLAFRPRTGYHFIHKTAKSPQNSTVLSVHAIAPDPNGPLATYWVKVRPPPYTGPFPPMVDGEVETAVLTKIARQNKPPQPRAVLLRADGRKRVLKNGQSVSLPVGSALAFDSRASRDPEGKQLIATHWEIRKIVSKKQKSAPREKDGGRKSAPKPPARPRLLKQSRKRQIGLRLRALGTYHLKLTVYDSCGARSSATFTVVSHPPRIKRVPRRCGCCTQGQSALALWSTCAVAVLFVLATLGLLLWTRRRPLRRPPSKPTS